VRLARQSGNYGVRMRQNILTSSSWAQVTVGLLSEVAWDYQVNPVKLSPH
jgi:hypothetical protein